MKRKIVVSLMILMFPMLVGCQKETMTLKIDSVTVEYGSSISVKAEDYLKNEKDFLDKVEVAVNEENEKDTLRLSCMFVISRCHPITGKSSCQSTCLP